MECSWEGKPACAIWSLYALTGYVSLWAIKKECFFFRFIAEWVLRKIHKDFNNILVSGAIDLYLQEKNWRWNLRTPSEANLEKNEESLFGPPVKRVVQEISPSDDSSSESDSSEPDSN